MKRLFYVLLFFISVVSVNAQQSFYQDKLAEFSKMRRVDTTDVVMLGDEFTEYAGDWNVLLHWHHIRNRGIAGDNISRLSARLNPVMSGHPKAVFVMIGARDLLNGMTPSVLLDRYASLINNMKRQSPKTKIFIQSILPINETYNNDELKGKTNTIAVFNRDLRHYCERHNIQYINLFKSFVRHGTNELRRELTQDGYALSPFGYKLWSFELKKYLIDL